jgi:hypothetical protein|tara:strand:+ start:303 stop:488 length:186 start_codon:yes stop_codon:yes gene_type:complete
MSIYEEKGYADRTEYLEELSLDHEVSMKTVLLYSDLLGPNEDFDGLPSALEECNLFRAGAS